MPKQLLFRNFYQCYRCNHEWEDVWSATAKTIVRVATPGIAARTKAKTKKTTSPPSAGFFLYVAVLLPRLGYHPHPLRVRDKLPQYLRFGEPEQLIFAFHFGTLAAERFHCAIVLYRFHACLPTNPAYLASDVPRVC